MPTKEQLIKKITNPVTSKAFTKNDLFSLMQKCECEILSGGRGSAVKFYNREKHAKVVFDLPHPQKELYLYQIKKIIEFLERIGEIENEK